MVTSHDQTLIIDKKTETKEYRLEIACAEAVSVLSHDERIRTVHKTRTALSFETNMIWSVQLKGISVPVGRFEVIICPEERYIKTKWIERKYPFYLYMAGEGFCFGSRSEFLAQLQCAGEYLGVAYGVLDSFTHVNPKDVDIVLENYIHMQQQSL